MNSVGMTLVPIAPGTFEMGVDSVPLPPELIKGAAGVTYDRLTGEGDYDETPVRRVTITRPFLISQTEVTIEQYRQFRPGFRGSEYWAPYASGISWHDAVAFCDWLSEKEGKPYRLPTEAEWEYVCRAGTHTPFSSGMQPPEPGVANAWNVKNMHDAVPEWCLDWHGTYANLPQTDPVGPVSGIAKIVRGGGLDFRQQKPADDTGHKMPAELAYFRRSANRASVAPAFSSPDGHIGFRIVQAEMPTTVPTPVESRLFVTGIRQDKPILTDGPDPAQPYYRTRPLFPSLNGQDMRALGWKIGFAPGLGNSYHNSAVQMCDNGDVVASYYNTTRWEDDPEQTLLTMRLRHGADEWDIPEPWPDFADADVAAPVFWNDGAGTLWFFFGTPRLLGGPPFWFMTSTDSGATWSPVQSPKLEGPIGPFTSQPINSVVRDRDGTIYLAVDGEGSTSVLFATHDNGKTWRDTQGRTMGRHTSFVLGADGKTLLGFGGKNSNLEGFMPLSISRDGGATYEHIKTSLMPLASGQRPSVIRLASGRLFFVADTLSSKVPGGRTASFVAVSNDEGTTWTQRILPINSTVGYVTAMQAPNGVIHIVTSKSKPAALHIELNETWIVHGGAEVARHFRKAGTESFHNADGSLRWERIHAVDGTSLWRVYADDGRLIAESRWKDKTLVEVLTISGKPLLSVQ